LLLAPARQANREYGGKRRDLLFVGQLGSVVIHRNPLYPLAEALLRE
jgi:hypothetical protein